VPAAPVETEREQDLPTFSSTHFHFTSMLLPVRFVLKLKSVKRGNDTARACATFVSGNFCRKRFDLT
jgi:hypothetical protein